MANTDNTCSTLEIKFETAEQFDELVNMQEILQERIQPGFYNPNASLKEVADFFIKNKHALEDELNETIDAIGGIHDGIGSAAWKWWKSKNKDGETLTLKHLSDRDKIELKMEIVDQFHFLMNQMIKIGMTGSELYSMYKSKNKENFNRQDNGY